MAWDIQAVYLHSVNFGVVLISPTLTYHIGRTLSWNEGVGGSVTPMPAGWYIPVCNMYIHYARFAVAPAAATPPATFSLERQRGTPRVYILEFFYHLPTAAATRPATACQLNVPVFRAEIEQASLVVCAFSAAMAMCSCIILWGLLDQWATAPALLPCLPAPPLPASHPHTAITTAPCPACRACLLATPFHSLPPPSSLLTLPTTPCPICHLVP